MDKKTTIHLTGRRPVEINAMEWPIIATAKWHDGVTEAQARERAWIKVRERALGTGALVYGLHAGPGGEVKAGELIDEGTYRDVETAILKVAHAIGRPDLAQRAINELPAEVLS